MDHDHIGDDMPMSRAFINDVIMNNPGRGFGLFELYNRHHSAQVVIARVKCIIIEEDFYNSS